MNGGTGQLIQTIKFGSSFELSPIKYSGVFIVNHHKKVFIDIIKLLEDRDWEYQVTYTHIQVEIGNEFYNVSKTDLIELLELREEVMCW